MKSRKNSFQVWRIKFLPPLGPCCMRCSRGREECIIEKFLADGWSIMGLPVFGEVVG
jgi:hypothetical protein